MSTSSASRSAAAAGRPAINTHLHKRGPAMRVHRAQTNRRAARVAPRAAAGEAASKEVTGVVFQPFDEVQVELASVDRTDSAVQSFARCDFHPECEAAINEQINVEYNISYVYHAMHAYFDRDNVGLPGIAAYFKDGSEEERSHAEMLMTYQNMRGGRVKLGALVVPETDFNHVEKGEALYAMELSLSLEKLNFQKLNQLHVVAERHGDSQMCDFIEGSLLAEQVDDIKKVSAYVSQLRRVGKGHGVYDFDRHFNDGAE